MKEATGELNMTVITLVAIAAVAALFYFAVWPLIQQMLMNNTCKTYGNYTAVKGETAASNTGNATVNVWACCPDGTTAVDDSCIVIDSGETTE